MFLKTLKIIYVEVDLIKTPITDKAMLLRNISIYR